jgi:tellurite resistance protein
MADFNNKTFLEALCAALPNANVRDGALTLEQKKAKLERLHAINQLYSHNPTLGNGLLGAVKIKGS